MSVLSPGLDYEEGATRSVTVRATSEWFRDNQTFVRAASKTVEVTVNDVAD